MFCTDSKISLKDLWKKNPLEGSQDKDAISGSGHHRVPNYLSQEIYQKVSDSRLTLLIFFLKHLLLVIVKRVGGWIDIYPDPLQLLFLVHMWC